MAAGNIQPLKYVDVGAQISGRLKSLKVDRGNQVGVKQLLAEIDPSLAEASLTAANAMLENITAQHAVKQAQLGLAKVTFERNRKLFEKQLLDAENLDISKANYDIALADVAALAAQMKGASAEVETAKTNLGYTKITAPMAGEVVSINALEGQTLNANQQAPNILRIANIDTVTVWAQVSEADISLVKVGQDAYFTVLGQSRRWDGKVRQILDTPELINNVVFYDVLFDVPNPDHDLKIQMTAQVFIILAQAKNILIIPNSVVGNAGEGNEIKVRVLKNDGTLEPRKIKLGIKNEISTEVREGLNEKEKIVIREITSHNNSKGGALTSSRGF